MGSFVNFDHVSINYFFPLDSFLQFLKGSSVLSGHVFDVLVNLKEEWGHLHSLTYFLIT